MSKAIAVVVVTALVCAITPEPAFGQDRPLPETAIMWRAEAARLPIGSIVRLRVTGGGTMTAVLLAVDEAGVTVKPKARIAEHSRHVSFDDIDRLERYNGHVSFGKYAAVGAGIGAAAFLVLLALANE